MKGKGERRLKWCKSVHLASSGSLVEVKFASSTGALSSLVRTSGSQASLNVIDLVTELVK